MEEFYKAKTELLSYLLNWIRESTKNITQNQDAYAKIDLVRDSHRLAVDLIGVLAKIK